MGYKLILDTSSKDLTVAISDDIKVLAKVQYYAWQRQSETAVSEIDHLLTKLNLSPKDISSVILTIGPGSYTGVRIALTIGKVFALVNNIKIKYMTSLRALAGVEGRVLAIIDARSKRSYVGLYENGKPLENEKIMLNEEIVSYAKEHNFVIKGEVETLGYEKENIDIAQNMLEVSKLIEEEYTPHEVKPLYLKD